jgi:hypothetical protein
MISEKFKDLIGRSINSISSKEQIYDLIDKLSIKEKIDYSDLKRLSKDIELTSGSLHQYFTNHIKEDVENSLLNLFKEKSISVFDRQFIKEYSNSFMDCFNHRGCSKYRKSAKEVIDKIGKNKFETWNKAWNPDNVKSEVDRVATEAVESYTTHRYSEEVIECFVNAASSKSFQNSIDNCQEIHKIGIDSIKDDLYF